MLQKMIAFPQPVNESATKRYIHCSRHHENNLKTKGAISLSLGIIF